MLVLSMSVSIAKPSSAPADIEARVAALLAKMTLTEKIGQMSQRNAGSQHDGEGVGASR